MTEEIDRLASATLHLGGQFNFDIVNHLNLNIKMILNAERLTVAEFLESHSEQVVDIKKIAIREGLNEDYLIVFLMMAYFKTLVPYKENELQQRQINFLYETFGPYSDEIPPDVTINRIRIDVEGAKTIDISNHPLLANISFHIMMGLKSFLLDYVRKHYKPIKGKKGKRRGQEAESKKLAKDIFSYLRATYQEKGNHQLGGIIISIFELAGNPLPYDTPKIIYQKLLRQGTENT